MKLELDIDYTVRHAIARAASVPMEKVTDEATLRGDLGMDSLDELEAIVMIEKSLPIEQIPDGAMGNIHTVRDLIEYVKAMPVKNAKLLTLPLAIIAVNLVLMAVKIAGLT